MKPIKYRPTEEQRVERQELSRQIGCEVGDVIAAILRGDSEDVAKLLMRLLLEHRPSWQENLADYTAPQIVCLTP